MRAGALFDLLGFDPVLSCRVRRRTFVSKMNQLALAQRVLLSLYKLSVRQNLKIINVIESYRIRFSMFFSTKELFDIL